VSKMVKITKVVAEKRLGDVSQEKQFWCHDGHYLKNLQELEIALEQMSDETFHYHVNEIKSDFSNWVRDIIGDDKLSRDLRMSVTRDRAARSVAARIDLLSKRREN
jgi:sporulation-control protein spo0M